MHTAQNTKWIDLYNRRDLRCTIVGCGTTFIQDTQDSNIEAAEDNECPNCAGTGEGQFEGQSCGACRGRGY